MGCCGKVLKFLCCYQCCRPGRTMYKRLRRSMMTRAEKDVSYSAERLFRKVDQDVSDCCCDLNELGKAETMLLIKVLQDRHRSRDLNEYAPLIDSFVAELRKASKAETDGGQKVTEEEFSEAFLTALNAYQKEAVDLMVAEVSKNYHNMDRDLTSGTASAVEVQVEVAKDTWQLPKQPENCTIS